MSARTLFRIHVTRRGRRELDSEFSMLDAAVAHAEWIMRHNPNERVTIDIIPPTTHPRDRA